MHAVRARGPGHIQPVVDQDPHGGIPAAGGACDGDCRARQCQQQPSPQVFFADLNPLNSRRGRAADPFDQRRLAAGPAGNFKRTAIGHVTEDGSIFFQGP